MNRRQTADQGVIVDHNMPAQGRVIGEHHAVADLAILADMAADHALAAAADAGGHAAALGPGVHGDMLANGVAGADFKRRRLAMKF